MGQGPSRSRKRKERGVLFEDFMPLIYEVEDTFGSKKAITRKTLDKVI